MVKLWKHDSLAPQWKGPYAVVLTSPTAVKVAGVTPGIHHMRVERADHADLEDCGLGVICPVSVETTYQLENQAPWMEEPQGSYLDSLLPKRIP